MPPRPSRSAIARLLRASHSSHCPCHGCAASSAAAAAHGFNAARVVQSLAQGGNNAASGRGYATPVDGALQKEYAFEMAASSIRFGEGVTREVGFDLSNMKATKVGVFTDPTVRQLAPVKTALESLDAQGLKYEVFDRVRVEPNDKSWAEAIDYARQQDFSHFLAVGGGSVMDTAKVANLFTVYKDAELLDFTNAPVGKGKPVDRTLRPLVAVPTTAGTGSETTGTAIFDHGPSGAKTGIASRALRPTIGIVDPLNTATCPVEVHISSGLDVLFHSLESYTAIPYTERMPRPQNPLARPAYQGANPISDIFSLWALKQTVKYLPRLVRDKHDKEAREHMMLGAALAGVGFGNAGVHLCHGISYAVSGLNKRYAHWQHPGYSTDHPIVPHGISVALTGPAVFDFTSPSSPDRHREVAAIFGARGEAGVDEVNEVKRLPDSEIGPLLYDRIAAFLAEVQVPRGLSAIGYGTEHIADLVKGTLPQRRVLDLAPGIGDVVGADGREHLAGIIERSMKY